MFNNAGKKIKIVAECGFWVEAIGSFITFLALCIDEEEPLYLLAMLGSIAVAWVISLLVYGFGEIVDKHCDPVYGDAKSSKTVKAAKPADKRVEVSGKEYRQAKKAYNESKNTPPAIPRIEEDEDEMLVIEAEDDGSVPQTICPKCGKEHDFDYPKCPYCKYKY